MATEQKVSALENDLKNLKSEFSEVSKLLKDIGENQSDKLSRRTNRAINHATSRAEDIWNEIEGESDDIFNMLSEKFRKASRHVERSAKDNPLATVGLIAGVSLLVGYLFNNRH